MVYVPLDLGFVDDPKIMRAGLDGAGLYAQSLVIAKRLMSDGVLERMHLYRLGADDALIDRLIDLGLYQGVTSGRTDPDVSAVRISAWLKHNKSVSELQEARASDAQRKRLTRGVRPNGRNGTSENVRSIETETEKKTDTRERESFEAWWSEYPRKVARQEAAKAYAKALRRSDPAAILAGLHAHKAMWEAEQRPPDKVPHAATWLNGERWRDDVAPPPPTVDSTGRLVV